MAQLQTISQSKQHLLNIMFSSFQDITHNARFDKQTKLLITALKIFGLILTLNSGYNHSVSYDKQNLLKVVLSSFSPHGLSALFGSQNDIVS